MQSLFPTSPIDEMRVVLKSPSSIACDLLGKLAPLCSLPSFTFIAERISTSIRRPSSISSLCRAPPLCFYKERGNCRALQSKSAPNQNSGRFCLSDGRAGGSPGRPNRSPAHPSRSSTHPNHPDTHPNRPPTHPNRPPTHPSRPSTHPNRPPTRPNRPDSHPSRPDSHPSRPDGFPNRPRYPTRGPPLQSLRGCIGSDLTLPDKPQPTRQSTRPR